MLSIFATVAFDVIENFDEVTRLVDAGDVGFFIVKLEDKLLRVSTAGARAGAGAAPT